MKIPGWRRRMLASTRGKILALLRVDSRTVNELAKALRLTENAVRSHLTSLERDGLVQKLGTRPGFRKPHVLYSLAAEAEHFSPLPMARFCAIMIAVIARRLPSQELQASLREVGRTAAAEHLDQVAGKTSSQRIEIALNALKVLGGDATVVKRRKRFILGMVAHFLQPLPIIRKLA